MDIIDAELASRPAASIEPKGTLPCLLTATQAKLPKFAAHCTSMVTAAPLLVHTSELEGCGKDIIVVYMKAMQGRMQGVKQLLEQALKELSTMTCWPRHLPSSRSLLATIHIWNYSSICSRWGLGRQCGG